MRLPRFDAGLSGGVSLCRRFIGRRSALELPLDTGFESSLGVEPGDVAQNTDSSLPRATDPPVQ